jgi:A/G-specific adenine glycosylase
VPAPGPLDERAGGDDHVPVRTPRVSTPPDAPSALTTGIPPDAPTPTPPAPRAEPPPHADLGALSPALLAWFDTHGRTLTIRTYRDSWAVLVTEVMSQQTQIGRVEERVPAFLAAFPGPADLAVASTTELLRAWAGLGYNRRAVALREAARAIVERHGGSVPGDLTDLEALPGIGPYTARAVAARAFGLPVAALDVNVRRVLGRVHPRSTGGPPGSRRDLQAAGDRLVDARRPGPWNDAVMDLAASICTPRLPACPACPVRAWCATASGAVPAGAVAHTDAGTDAGASPRAHGRPTRAAVPFPATRRWLRGRLVAELREMDAGSWLTVNGPRGPHTARTVAETLRDLEREGLVELDPGRGARLR